jgi:glycosyltransferase involved in cell wall biosynthesis
VLLCGTRMRIGVNVLYLIPGAVGGTEIYLRSLLGALAEIDRVNEYLIFTNRETAHDLAPPACNFHLIPQPVPAQSRPARILWEQIVLPVLAARRHLDVMLNPGFTAPLFCGCPQVTVFHDLQHKRHPEYFRWFDLPFWNLLLFWSAHVSRRILAVSAATASDLQEIYRLPESRIDIVPHGVDPVFFKLAELRHDHSLTVVAQKAGVDSTQVTEPRRRTERFLLAVSTLHPHKNLDGLLQAFAIFRQSHPDFRLIVCGLHGFFTGPLHDLRDQLGLREAVDFPGWIPRQDLYELYARAWAFVYPSLFEGFGLPVLEALAAGVPAACSNIEPVASVAGDAALQFDPRDREAMLQALLRIAGDEQLRQRLAETGPRRAAEYSWKETAAKTLDSLSHAASEQ